MVQYANTKFPSSVAADLSLLSTDDMDEILKFSSKIPEEMNRDEIIQSMKETIVKNKAI